MGEAKVAEGSRTNESRTPELDRLAGWFEAEPGSVVVLHGRRGVGKARLAEALVRLVGARPGAVVFEARVPELGGRCFHPFAEIAHRAMMWAEQAGLPESVIDAVYADLSPVLDYAVAEEAGESPSLDQKLRFFEGFRRLLLAVGERARILAVVHDLERADPDTLELASYLSEELFGDPALDPESARPGLLLLSCRDDEQTAPQVTDFLEEMLGRPSVRSVRLAGLDLEGLRRYVQSPHVLEKLLAASEGLPQELDALIESLPSNVEELFERKMAEMESLEHSLLSALAVSARPSSARNLAEVVQQPVRIVAKSLNGLRDHKVLDRRIINGEFHFNFLRRRDLEVAERSLSDDERRSLHQGWAIALGREPEQGATALLAHHQLRSAEPQRGVPLAIQAAETYAVGGAFHAALEMLEEALPHATGELRLSILNRVTEIAPLVGSPKRALRYVESWKDALPEEQQGRALQREAELLNTVGEYEAALQALDEARSHTPDGALVERAKVEATASEAHYQHGQREDAEHAGREGLELLAAAEGAAPGRVKIELLNMLGKIALAEEDYRRATQFFEQTLKNAQEYALPDREARALINLALTRIREGDLASSEETLETAIQTARDAGDLVGLAFGYLNLGTVLHQRGELGRAIDCYRECKSLFRRLGNRTQLARTLCNFGNIYLLCGDLERAKAHVHEALRLAKQSGVDRVAALGSMILGAIELEEGHRVEGERRIREALNLLRLGQSERGLEAHLELAEALIRFGEHDQARAILDEVESGRSEATPAAVSGRIDLVRGQLALAERGSDAEARFEAARAQFEALGRPLMIRDAELGLAQVKLLEGQRSMTRQHLVAAEHIQERIARALPDDVRKHFDQARPQQVLGEIIAQLEGRAPAPDAVTLDLSTGGASEVVEAAARKPEWKRRYGSIIGNSPKILKTFHILDRVADSDGTVLIFGESGTGKELVAEAIHRNSPRSKGPFVKLNCAALVETLLLSELFGHERGSFTGAHQRKIGRFEMAAGGTLFLDEIGDISPKTQVALLRVLQEREFERVGGGRPIKVDARIIFATNRNLPQMVRDGTFREDLYYRIRGIQVDLPPLRERTDDIPALAQHFLAQYGAESATVEKRFSPGAAELLRTYGWPGNIRELENIVRSVALFAEGHTITERDFDEYSELFQDGLGPVTTSVASEAPTIDMGSRPQAPAVPTDSVPPSGSAGPPQGVASVPMRGSNGDGKPDELLNSEQAIESELLAQVFNRGVPLPELKKMIQLQAITRALRMTDGNITRAAEMLGMRRPRLSQIINADDDLKALSQGMSK
jgi:transcriptional regulator with GAF, ATPase, and Fis domain/energy-coupling factor transporter ATP-binding protein EcfA2